MSDIGGRLKEWGNAQVMRQAKQYDGPSGGNSVLSDIAVGTRKTIERPLLGRDGRSRRRYMVSGMRDAHGRPVMAIAPMWACDPVPARNDAGRPVDHPKAWVDIGLPDEVRPIDDAINQLRRAFPMRAAVLVEEYTTHGKQEAKAKRVQERYGGQLSLRQYRHELEKAKEWMRGRIG